MRERSRLHMRAALICGLLLAMFAEVAASQEPVVDPPGRVARLSHTDGEVSLAPAGTEEFAEALLNRPITSGDQLWLDDSARAELQVGNATVHLDENTAFSFIELDDDVMQMSVTEGVASIRVRRRGEREVIQVETPNATVSLLHPGEYTIEVDPRVDQTIVRTRTGDAEVLAGDDSHVVRAGEEGRFTGLDALKADVGRLAGRSDFEDWANDRERRYQRAQSTRYVSDDMVGYEDLDEHGDWVHVSEYGHVWRPRHVAYDWAPYRYGRWVWMSPWGWTWVDEARWGFAPFHYGRWARVHERWCWVPGPRHVRPVYGPAFVAWMGSPGVSVSISSGVGWYPLGPREVYVPWYRHSPRYVRHVNVSNTYIINNTYITNIYSGRDRHYNYRYGNSPEAITIVDRDHFVRGRTVGSLRHRLSDRDIREWRTESRPPALTPVRESVLAGLEGVRSSRNDDRPRRADHRLSSRIPFEEERRLAERNGGRPPGRSELFTRSPRDTSTFRGVQPGERTITDRQRTEEAVNRARESIRARGELREDAIRSPERWRDRQVPDTRNDERRAWREAQRLPEVQPTPRPDNDDRAWRGDDAQREQNIRMRTEEAMRRVQRENRGDAGLNGRQREREVSRPAPEVRPEPPRPEPRSEARIAPQPRVEERAAPREVREAVRGQRERLRER